MRINSKTKSLVFLIIYILLFVLAAFMQRLNRLLPASLTYFYGITFLIGTGMFLSLFLLWIVSVYNRILQKKARFFLMANGIIMMIWIAIRSLKWIDFAWVPLEDRLLWYSYYIPMIMLPMFFFFTSLFIGENEDFRHNPKWNFLFIPAIFLIITVLTNDFHFLTFNNLDTSIRTWSQDYQYGVVYFIVLAFISAVLFMSLVLIIKKFGSSANARKASRAPISVFCFLIIYTLVYIMNPHLGIGYYFLDLTTFSGLMVICFWEACIRTGLIHSNQRHRDFFTMADFSSQILNENGELVFTSHDATSIKKEDFTALKTSKTVELENYTYMHMSPIKGGYVTWLSDVSQVHKIINELDEFNDKLSKEVELLSYENEVKSQEIRQQKAKDLQSVMLKEILPHSEKIKSELAKKKDASIAEIKDSLFETTMISTYLKRKVNLILIAQTEKTISCEEMQRCFTECFQLLLYHGKACKINILHNFDMSPDMAMLTFDTYQSILEALNYDFDTLYVSYDLRAEHHVFIMQISSNITLDIDGVQNYYIQKLSKLSAVMQIDDEDDNYYISIKFSK